MKQLLFLLFSFFLLNAFSLFAQDSSLASPPTVTTEITFAEPSFDYGMIEQGERVVHTYHFTNTGTEPLVLSSAKGSCGCTVPAWPKEPIFPGESGEVVVAFNSSGKKGKQVKRVTLVTNTDPAQTFLTIQGEVFLGESVSEKIRLSENEAYTAPPVRRLADRFVVYPNPAKEVVQVKLKEVVGEFVRLAIYDELGRVMEERRAEPVALVPMGFDVSTYPAGTYRMVVQVDGGELEAKAFLVVRE